jgi:uncharacterized protein (DUF2132 family)
MEKEPQSQANNPMHGITLEMMLTELVTHLGWEKMAEKIPINCFMNDPSISSSLKFLRKTPWARQKVMVMYSFNLNKINKAKSKS